MGRLSHGWWVIVGVLGMLAGTAGAEGPPSPAGAATIVGTVLQQGSNTPIPEAGVEVVGQTAATRTGKDGTFKLAVPPGTYELRIFAPQYQGLRLRSIVVKADKPTKIKALLKSTKTGVQVVETVRRAAKAAAAAQMEERRTATVAKETVAAESIKKSSDTNVAQVLNRVVGCFVEDEEYLVCRGLNERFSVALMNKSLLPSPDPNRRAVPLRLFPSDFIDAISVYKTYSPELPGDFIAATLDIQMKDPPDKLTGSVSGGTSGNTQATFQPMLRNRGSRWDRLTLGGEARELPRQVPDNVSDLSDLEAARVGRTFTNNWATHMSTAPLNTNVKFSLGNTFFNKLGVAVAGLWENEYRSEDETDATYSAADQLAHPDTLGNHFTYRIDRAIARVGGLLTADYRLTDVDKLTFRTIMQRTTEDQVRDGAGFTDQLGPKSLQLQTNEKFTSRELDMGQLGGEHDWGSLQTNWRLAFGRTIEDVPDNRYITYQTNDPSITPPTFSDDSLGGSRFYDSLTEKLLTSQIDFTVPFQPADWLQAKLRFGPGYTYRDRDFDRRRFVSTVPQGAFDLTQPANVLLDPKNFVPGGVTFSEETRPNDRYKASQDIWAGYGLGEFAAFENKLRLTAGSRVEYSYIKLQSYEFGKGPVTVVKNDLGPMPAVNLIYSPVPEANIRLGWSRTVGRPEFRELAPTEFTETRGQKEFVGNPDVRPMASENYDFRSEYYLSPLEIVSLSYFEKHITDLIVPVTRVVSSNVATTIVNADTALFRGFEFEVQKNFGFVRPALRDLMATLNLTYMLNRDVTVENQPLIVQQSTDHTAPGSIQYIVNVALDYTHPSGWSTKVAYFHRGDKTEEIGGYLPDSIYAPYNQVDFSFLLPMKDLIGMPLTLKFTARNLTDDARRIALDGGIPTKSYNLGRRFGLEMTYNF